MKRARTLTLLSVLTLVSCGLRAQYSPYYFYDSLKDNGVQTIEHYEHLGKILLDAYPMSRAEITASGDTIMQADAFLTAHIYLKRSFKYYFIKYQSDSTCNPKDWDYNGNQPKLKPPDYWSGDKRMSFFVCVLICDTDTVAAWRQVLRNNEYTAKTAFRIHLWNDVMSASDEKYYRPLVDYVGRNKITGTHEIKMYVYAGKMQCNRVADRGPECLAAGKIKLHVTEEDLKKLLDQKMGKKLKFPTCEESMEIIKFEKLK